jgi:hypothetical protein
MTSKLKSEQVDGRFYPTVVKLLDTILQSLDQMRTLSPVDESPASDLAAAVEVRIAHTKAQRFSHILSSFTLSLITVDRCMNLARCYEAVKRYAEVIQHANLCLREARAAVSEPESDILSTGDPAYFRLSTTDLARLESDLAAYALVRIQRRVDESGRAIHSPEPTTVIGVSSPTVHAEGSRNRAERTCLHQYLLLSSVALHSAVCF